MSNAIPYTWTPLWWARHKPTGNEYRIGDSIDRGKQFHPDARHCTIKRIYQTPRGWVVALVKYQDGFSTILGLHPGHDSGSAFEVDPDVKYQRGEARCAFCGRTVVVHLWNNRKRDKCQCGATHFFRCVRQGGKVVAESEGWRKDGKEIVRC